MTCVRDWFQIHQQALHTKLFTEAKACVPCYRWHGHAGPGPAQWGLASGAARTQWLITMPCTAVGPLRQHGGQVTTPLPQQLLLSLWQRKGQTLLFFLGHYPVPRSLTQAAPRCRNAPGRLVAQTLLLPDPDPSPWGGGRGGSQETLPPGEACDAKPLLRRHIFQVQTTYGHSLYFTGLCCEGPAGKKEKSYHPDWKTSKILALIFLLINDTHLKTRKNYGTCNCLLLLFPKKPTFEPSQWNCSSAAL